MNATLYFERIFSNKILFYVKFFMLYEKKISFFYLVFFQSLYIIIFRKWRCLKKETNGTGAIRRVHSAFDWKGGAYTETCSLETSEKIIQEVSEKLFDAETQFFTE